MKIIIGFSKPKNKIFPWFSWLIRLYQNTEYSHVYIRWEARGISENICYQASGSQVNFIGSDVFAKEIQPIFEYEMLQDLSVEQRRNLFKFAISKAGKPYGIKEVFGLLYSRFIDNSHNKLDDEEHYICSELISTILKDELEVDLGKEASMTMPVDIQKYLDKSLLFKRIL